MRGRGCARAARQDELLERRDARVLRLGQCLEALDVRRGDHRVAGNADFAAEIEQVVLDLEQRFTRLLRNVLGEHGADHRVQLVDVAQRLDAQRVLRNTRAVAEPGGAGVAGARDDFRQAMTHGMLR